jgi:Flp pilus assembly CpaE family ATPase
VPIVCEPVARAGDLSLCIGGQVHLADNLGTALRMLDRDPSETLVVIGPDVPTGDAFGFAARMRVERPAVGVVLLRTYVDVALLTHALQAGVREVVPAGDRAALSAACGRSREVSRRTTARGPVGGPERGRDGEVVTVFAAKGGVGKTTVAINLGVALAEGTGQRVCVVDLDLAFGDVAISVSLDPARTMVDGLPMVGHIDPTGAASLLTRYRPGLDMLLAPVTPGDADKVPPALVGELLSVLRDMFDYVVVDTPAQFSEHVLVAMDASAHHVLLTTPDTPALKNLRVTLDMLDLLSYPREIRSVLLNRSDSKVGLSLDDVERVVRCPVAAQVPSSRAVPVSINSGVPIVVSNPTHPVSQAITRFAEQRLLDTPVEVAAPRRSLARLRGKRRSA